MQQAQTKTKSSPLSWVPSAYFAMGLPLILINLVAPLMFKDFGISDGQIAFWTSLLILPWSLKPFWSPLMEMYRTKKFYVVTTQLLSGLSLAFVAMALPLPDFFPYVIAIMAVLAFSGATHDIALDGVYITELNKTQQAQYVGWQGAFYNLAKVTAMGGLVYIAGILMSYYKENNYTDMCAAINSWSIIMFASGVLLVGLGLYHWRKLPSGGASHSNHASAAETMRETWNVIVLFFKKKYIWIYVAWIICYRFTEGLVIKIVPLFLEADVANQGLGLAKEEMGLYYGTFGVIAFIAGSILGGYFISWIGLKRAIFPLCCIFNVPFVVYALLAIYQPQNAFLVCSGIVFEYFSYGFGFVGLTLFIMQQVAPGKHQMAHYAFGSALANLGVMLPGMISGYISDAIGYQQFFIWALVSAIPAFILTWHLPFTHPDTKEQVKEA